MSKIKYGLFIFGVLLIINLSGCVSFLARFSPPVRQDVEIVLKENDFKVTDTNIEGEATVNYLFTFIPLNDPRIYSRALGDLYSKVSSEITGNPAQLGNWTVDEVDRFYLFFFSTKTVRFRADLIKYHD